MATESRTEKEGRVNVALGDEKKRLKKLAKKNNTTESNFARVLLTKGMDEVENGNLIFRGPSVEPAAK